MNELTIPDTLKPAMLSAQSTEAVRRLRRALRPEGERVYSISKDLAPTQAAREGLERRRDLLENWHHAAGPEAVAPFIDLMLGVLRLKAEGEAEIALRRKAYHLAMADLPLYAVEQACTLALRGQVGDGTGRWAPQPGELHKAAERVMSALVLELTDIRSILMARIDPPRPTPERRAEIVAQVRGFIAEAARSREPVW